MLKSFAEFLEREFPVLVSRPWLSSLAFVVIAVIIAVLWLTTAWRLGKWYYSREIAALQSENRWLQNEAVIYRRRIRSMRRRLGLRDQ